MRPRTSPIWNYFVEIDTSRAKCIICGKIYSRKGRTTTALKSHLRVFADVEKFAEFAMLDEAVKISLGAKKQEIKMALTPAERMRKYRENLKKYNPEKFEELRKKNLTRIKAKKKNINELTKKEKEKRRKVWRDEKIRKKLKKNKEELNPEQVNVRSATTVRSQEKKATTDKYNSNNYYKKKINNLQKKTKMQQELIDKLIKLQEMYKKRYYRLQMSKKVDIDMENYIKFKLVGGPLKLSQSNDPLNISEETDVVFCDTPCTSKQNTSIVKKSGPYNLDQQRFADGYTSDFYASDNESSDVETKQAMDFNASQLQIIKVTGMKNEESNDEEKEENNSEENRPFIEYSYEEERQVKKRRSTKHKEDYQDSARKMFLLSLLPDIQAFNDAEMSTFRKDVILSIDKIISARKKSK